MAKKILPGELFIILYQDGGGLNQWAINRSKTAIELRDGHLVRAGITDVLIESMDPGVPFTSNRGNLDMGDPRIHMLRDVGYGKQTFGGQLLNVLKVKNTTDIFNSSGTKIGSVPAGTEIGISAGTAGNSMKHLLAFNAYDAKDGRGWRFANEAQYTHGFINIQQGFGLKMYNSLQAITTNFSETRNDIDWSRIAELQVGKTGVYEDYLRNIPDNDPLHKVKYYISHYFSSIDLVDEILGDPEKYFVNKNNRAYISNLLLSDYENTNDDYNKFNDEAEYFNSKITFV